MNTDNDDLINSLKEEIRVSDKIIEARDQLLDAIPECPIHGMRCVPHAIQWVEKVKRYLNENGIDLDNENDR